MLASRGRASYLSGRRYIFVKNLLFQLQHLLSQQLVMASTSYENKVLLALQALENNPKLSPFRAAKIYKVARMTLARRRNGQPSRGDITVKSRKMTNLEEKTIVERVLELGFQGFPVRLSSVEDMANRLRRDRNGSPVGKRWASNFVRRQPELQTRLTRSYGDF